jgi:DNA (cytosine-5)-methyltransferase 1
MLETLEICAGAGGAALGLEQAGFSHVALADNDSNACATLRLNRPHWQVIEADIAGGAFDSRRFQGVDLFTGGLPCPPFSVAGQQPLQDDKTRTVVCMRASVSFHQTVLKRF